MKQKSKRHRLRIILSLGLGLFVIVAIFLYGKIVYFPDRSEQKDADIALSFLTDQGDLARAHSIDINVLRSFTGDYIVSFNTMAAVERFYKKTHDQKAALSLLQMYITYDNFDEAFALIKDLYHNDIDFSLIPPSTFLYILFNSSELTTENDGVIRGILDDYVAHGRINHDTATFYAGLLSLYKGDKKSFYASLDLLSGSASYASLVSRVDEAKKTSQDVLTTLPYYADGLSALALLQEGYFRVAQKRAVVLRSQDPKYILPYQILAQAALLQSHRDEASQYFSSLLDMDNSHPSQYQFGMCASAFRLKNYTDALLHCQQVKDRNLPDALRYMLLSYYQMKDWQGMMDTFQKILLQPKISENDYYTFFDIVFFHPFVSDKDFSHVQKYYVSVILPSLNQCVSSFGSTSTVCKYGQAGFYLYKDQLSTAYNDLLFLASHHPSGYVFRALGQYYDSQGDASKAKAYYLRAMSTSTGGVIDISSAKSGAGNTSMNE